MQSSKLDKKIKTGLKNVFTVLKSSPLPLARLPVIKYNQAVYRFLRAQRAKRNNALIWPTRMRNQLFLR